MNSQRGLWVKRRHVSLFQSAPSPDELMKQRTLRHTVHTPGEESNSADNKATQLGFVGYIFRRMLCALFQTDSADAQT